jgi:hypothetical protein
VRGSEGPSAPARMQTHRSDRRQRLDLGRATTHWRISRGASVPACPTRALGPGDRRASCERIFPPQPHPAPPDQRARKTSHSLRATQVLDGLLLHETVQNLGVNNLPLLLPSDRPGHRDHPIPRAKYLFCSPPRFWTVSSVVTGQSRNGVITSALDGRRVKQASAGRSASGAAR